MSNKVLRYLCPPAGHGRETPNTQRQATEAQTQLIEANDAVLEAEAVKLLAKSQLMSGWGN